MKSIFWKLFLADGWYFIVIKNDWDHTAKAAYWNGYVWETRMEVIPDNRVLAVVGKVPERQGRVINGIEIRLCCDARSALAGFARLKSRIDRATRSFEQANKALQQPDSN